jgi:hypothetical protein
MQIPRQHPETAVDGYELPRTDAAQEAALQRLVGRGTGRRCRRADVRAARDDQVAVLEAVWQADPGAAVAYVSHDQCQRIPAPLTPIPNTQGR